MTRETLNIENARLIFKNFTGEETKFNRKGNRIFSILIEEQDVANDLLSSGWNVKELKPRDEDDDTKYFLQVSVNYENNPPKIWLITNKSKKKTLLNEDTVSTLDYADIETADLIINPYFWEINGKTGIKAYLKTAYVTIKEDEFESKYFGDDIEEMPF